jgi:membrane associated rhomboid family serine protease
MTDTGLIGILLIIANVIVSYKGFKDQAFFERYKFEVDRVLIQKDYKRLVTSGFLHANWPHLIFNMISLLAFSGALERYLGSWPLLLIYFTSLVGGELLSLFVHRHHGYYSSIGASGAVGGVIFASIALLPGMRIGFFILPISIPAWIYGVLFVFISIYGIQSKRDNTAHEAHLGGSLVGMLVAILLQPAALSYNGLTIALVAVPALIFIALIISRPHTLVVSNSFGKKSDHYSIDHKYNATKADRQKQIDAILDKISQKGMDSLSEKEKQLLKQYSRMKH